MKKRLPILVAISTVIIGFWAMGIVIQNRADAISNIPDDKGSPFDGLALIGMPIMTFCEFLPWIMVAATMTSWIAWACQGKERQIEREAMREVERLSHLSRFTGDAKNGGAS